ncbi:ATP-grasp domain-containing protein [Segatella paludivivens]|uniref:hypothetical protein n=1 Tax=Segatella paludivivens TaxID=185294 RepID=UPI000382EDB8|nr:hypothetical protein [Segatella paludivivens]
MKIIAVRRDDRFSPNSVEKDKAILQAVCDRLPYDISMIDEGKLSVFDEADVYLSMARLPETLTLLKTKEDEGAIVVNSAYGVETCGRRKLDNIMRDNDIPVPPSKGNSGYWLKRGDAAAQSKSDVVYCKDRETLANKEAEFVIRGITNWIVQAHVPGDLVKFYAVKGGFFKYFYPSDDGESKFGDEKLNGDACHYAFDEKLLKTMADKVAQITGIDVYGGDAIITEDGDFYIIDFNDWPSFSRCRDIAADTIAKLATKKNSLNIIKI